MSTHLPSEGSGQLLPFQVLSLAALSKRRTPLRDPIAIHLSGTEWERLIGDAPRTRIQLRPGMVGLTPVPDPYGGILAFPRCFTGDPDLECVPEIRQELPGGIRFGPCRCFRAPSGSGAGRVPVPPCSLRLDFETGRLQCVDNRCGGGCILMRFEIPAKWGGGPVRTFVSCHCRERLGRVG